MRVITLSPVSVNRMKKAAVLTVAEPPNKKGEFLPIGPTARNALFIQLEINDIKLPVLVDTGSAISQVPEATRLKYGWRVYKNTKMDPV